MADRMKVKHEPAGINTFTEPVSGREYSALQSLFAMISTFEVSEPILEKRCRRLGGGVWRDMRAVRALADRVIRALLSSVPPNKLAQVNRNFGMTRVYVRVEAPGIPTKDDTNYVYCPAASLDYLANLVLQDHCLLCDQTEIEGRKCPHRKAIEDCLPHALIVDRESDRCRFADLTNGFSDLQEVRFSED